MHKISIREEVLWTYNGDVLDTPDEETLLVVSPPFSTGEPGDIVINTACRYLPSGEQAMYMLLHAFGHAFGFGHTPESPGDKGDGSYIEGTAEYDPASIMVREADPLRWSGFSENDIKAFKAVYPTDEPEPEPEPEPEVDFSDRSMEWIADDGFAIAMGGPYAYGSVNIDVRVRLTGSEWADGQVRGMRIYDLYTGEEVMRGKAGSCRLQPGEYTLHYGAAVRREDGTFECRYGTADFEVTLPGFELTMPILSHPEDIDLSRTIVVRCSFETDDAAWRNFSCSVQLVNLRTGEEITHQSYTPNERWAFRLTERGAYRAVATVSNGSETLVIRKDFVLPELTNPKDIYQYAELAGDRLRQSHPILHRLLFGRSLHGEAFAAALRRLPLHRMEASPRRRRQSDEERQGDGGYGHASGGSYDLQPALHIRGEGLPHAPRIPVRL